MKFHKLPTLITICIVILQSFFILQFQQFKPLLLEHNVTSTELNHPYFPNVLNGQNEVSFNFLRNQHFVEETTVQELPGKIYLDLFKSKVNQSILLINSASNHTVLHLCDTSLVSPISIVNLYFEQLPNVLLDEIHLLIISTFKLLVFYSHLTPPSAILFQF